MSIAALPSISITRNPIKRENSLECTCEKSNLHNLKNFKCFTICDICSEKKFLKQTSTNKLSSKLSNELSTDSSTFSDD